MNPRLIVVGGPLAGHTFDVARDEITIGRDHTNDLSLSDPLVSRSHAKLFKRDGYWHVYDLQSSNGTVVNGRRINSPVQIRTADSIVIGNHTLRFEDSGVISTQPNLHQTQLSSLGDQLPAHPSQQPLEQPLDRPDQYAPSPQQPQPPQPFIQQNQQVVHVQGQNLTWLWIFLSIVALGPCGLFCVGFTLLAILPFIMIVAGLIFGIIGLYQWRQYTGHPGWQGKATAGIAMSIGGFAAAVLGAVWIFVAWFQDDLSLDQEPSIDAVPSASSNADSYICNFTVRERESDPIVDGTDSSRF